MKIVVTIPVYNEEETIGGVIDGVKKQASGLSSDYKIIVVDDGSTDKSPEIAKKHGAAVYCHPRNYGLAETFRTEVEKAVKEKPDIIVHIDADGQYDVGDIPRLIEPIKNGEAELVLGSRFLGKIEDMSFLKRQGNRAFSSVISHMTKTKITDAQTGFRAFTRNVAQKLSIKSRHTYTQEMVIRASREKFRIKEIPVNFSRRESGKSRLISNPFGYAARAWLNILRIYRDYEPLKFFGSIGAVLIGIGILLSVYIIVLLFTQGMSIIDQRIPTILVNMLFYVSGIQILCFGFLADRKV